MRPISFDCLSIAELLVCAGDEKIVLWQRARLEWRLKWATAMKDLKEKARSMLAILGIFWQSFYCPKQRCETCWAKIRWSLSQCGGFGMLQLRSLIVRRFRWI